MLSELNRFVYAILLTGIDDATDLARALEAGASDYVVKPFDRDTLRTRLRIGGQGVALQNEVARLRKLLKRPGMPEMALVDLNSTLEIAIDVSKSEWERVARVVTDLDPTFLR